MLDEVRHPPRRDRLWSSIRHVRYVFRALEERELDELIGRMLFWLLHERQDDPQTRAELKSALEILLTAPHLPSPVFMHAVFELDKRYKLSMQRDAADEQIQMYEDLLFACVR